MTETRCSCPDVQEFDGRVHPVVLDPDCREHSFPRDEWRANHPLRRHARIVERETGDRLTTDEARARCETIRRDGGVTTVDAGEWFRRFRDETPREVTSRLLGELAHA